MRSVDVDCNRDVSRAGRAHTRLVHRKERKEHTAGRCQSKTWSQKDEKSFVSPFLDPIFLTQDFFPPPLRANSCISCKAPFAFSAFFAVKNPAFTRLINRKEHTAGRCQSKTWSQKDEKSFVSHFLDPIFLTQDFFPPPLRASSCNSCKAPFAFSAFFAVINFAFSGSSHLPINSFYP